MISPSAVGIERIGPIAWLKQRPSESFNTKLQYNGSAIKKQDGGSPDFTRVGLMLGIEMRPSKRSFANQQGQIREKTSVRFFLSHTPSWPLPPR